MQEPGKLPQRWLLLAVCAVVAGAVVGGLTWWGSRSAPTAMLAAVTASGAAFVALNGMVA